MFAECYLAIGLWTEVELATPGMYDHDGMHKTRHGFASSMLHLEGYSCLWHSLC
jgi:hypothetical protein